MWLGLQVIEKAGGSDNPETMFKSGNPIARSREPVAIPRANRSVGPSLRRPNEALITEGSPEEAVKFLWEAARKGEPWAIQELCCRFAPQTDSLRMNSSVCRRSLSPNSRNDDQVDAMTQALNRPANQARRSLHPRVPVHHRSVSDLGCVATGVRDGCYAERGSGAMESAR